MSPEQFERLKRRAEIMIQQSKDYRKERGDPVDNFPTVYVVDDDDDVWTNNLFERPTPLIDRQFPLIDD